MTTTARTDTSATLATETLKREPVVIAELLNRLRAFGVAAEHYKGEHSYHSSGFEINGARVRCDVSLQRKGDYCRTVTGKLRVSIGDYGDNRRTYAEPTTHAAYNKIAAELVQRAADKAARRAALEAQMVRGESARELNDQTPSLMFVCEAGPERFKVELASLTAEQVRAIAAVVRDFPEDA